MGMTEVIKVDQLKVSMGVNVSELKTHVPELGHQGRIHVS